MADNNGISGGLEQPTLPLAMTLGAFTAVAWYNVIDLNVLIWLTFKKHRGLYFYSLLVSSWGIMIYALAFLMKFFQVWKNNYVSVTFITIGWYAMVTGQSLVLYSRLHLVIHDREKFKWVFYMIIIDIFLFQIPTTVVTFGANSRNAATFYTPYSIMEKIQLTGLCIQEFIISGLYLYATKQILQPGEAFQKKRFRRVMLKLVYVNVLVILMDITLLCLEYANLYDIQITFKSTVYSIKLRLEFAILNQLRSIVRPSGSFYNDGDVFQPGVRVISLNTFDNQNTIVQAHANGNSSNVYACNTTRQDNSLFHRQIDEDHVMMTSKVVVQSEDPKQGEKGAEGQAILGVTVEASRSSRSTNANGKATR